MTQITADRIQELIEKSRLVESDALAEAFSKILAKHGDMLPEDPVVVCKELEDLGLVTRWHCEKILQGKYKGFFLGKHKLLGGPDRREFGATGKTFSFAQSLPDDLRPS